MSDEDLFDAGAYWEDRLRRRYDLGGVGSIDLPASYNTWLYRVRRAGFRRWLAPVARREHLGSLLDVGAGTGFYVELWRNLGLQVTGLDITEVAVERLQQRFPESTFIRADIGGEHDISLPTFDAVSAFDVLFHIVDDAAFVRALERIGRAVRPGGLLFLSDLFQHEEPIAIEHQAGRTLSSMTAALASAGFDIISRRPVFYLMVEPTDRPPRWLQVWARCLARILYGNERLGYVAGAALYPIEVLLTRIVREGPSIELAICRKRR